LTLARQEHARKASGENKRKAIAGYEKKKKDDHLFQHLVVRRGNKRKLKRELGERKKLAQHRKFNVTDVGR